MPLSFSRSLRSLHADSSRRSLLAMGVGAALLAAWAGWFSFARVPVYEVSTSARVEAMTAAHAIEAPAAGRVVQSRLEVGRRVDAGELLVELDTTSVNSRIEEDEARRHGLEARLAALAEERRFEEIAGTSEAVSDQGNVDRAAAQLEQAVSAARVAAATAERTAQLHQKGLASEADLERDLELAAQRHSAENAARAELARLQSDREHNQSALVARLLEIDRDIATLRSEMQQLDAASGRAHQDVADRKLRAPVSGRLGDVTELQPGAFVEEGDRIAVVVPDGELKIVARFHAASAVGRIRDGQEARLRLDAMPWISYGQVEAVVAAVATEADEGTIRVEMTVTRSPESFALEHGLSGTAVVTVERISPALLVLRAVGKRVTPHHDSL